jgi:hypothetical protein
MALPDGRSTSTDSVLPTCIWVNGFRGHPGGEFHVGPHIMVVTPHPEDLQGFARDGWNGTYIIHLPGPDQADKRVFGYTNSAGR